MSDIVGFDWIEVHSVKVPRLIGLVTDLGAGEAEVLALALEQADSLSILDDKLARRIAKLQNLRITGTAGVLLKAKQAGFIETVSPLLNQLEKVGFRLGEDIKERILHLAEE